MDGATWCSWVIVCECPNVHRCKISQRFGPLLLKQQVFSQFFDMPENAPNSKDKQHRKHFMVRNDEKTRRRINSTRDVTMRPPVYISVSLCLRVCVCVCMYTCVQVCLPVYSFLKVCLRVCPCMYSLHVFFLCFLTVLIIAQSEIIYVHIHLHIA